MKSKVAPLLAISFFLMVLPIHALTLDRYESVKDDNVFKLYINGVGEGYSWANVFLKREDRPPLYCPPETMPLTPDNYLYILSSFIKRDRRTPLKPNFPLEMLLMKALQEAFPCKGE